MRSNETDRRDFLIRAGLAGMAAPAMWAAGAAETRAAAPAPQAPAKTAVITGGHSFDVIGYHKLFRRLDGVDAYIQNIDDFSMSDEPVRDGYDVLLFYIMMPDPPKDEGLPWYRGRPQLSLEHLGTTKQGIFLMHHALLAYPTWPPWSEIVGISDRKLKSYQHNQKMNISVVNPAHPITKGMKPWEIVDETYEMENAGKGCDVLLTTDHPKSLKSIAWTRQYKNSRVFCIELGHDDVAWSNPDFETVVRRGILWCAGRI